MVSDVQSCGLLEVMTARERAKENGSHLRPQTRWSWRVAQIAIKPCESTAHTDSETELEFYAGTGQVP